MSGGTAQSAAAGPACGAGGPVPDRLRAKALQGYAIAFVMTTLMTMATAAAPLLADFSGVVIRIISHWRRPTLGGSIAVPRTGCAVVSLLPAQATVDAAFPCRVVCHPASSVDLELGPDVWSLLQALQQRRPD